MKNILYGGENMSTWVTHLMIADRVLERVPELDRHNFCVGNIAPDCNVENDDWTQFTPSREVTCFFISAKNGASEDLLSSNEA